MAATPLLSVQNVKANYGPVEALRGVSLDVFPGEIVALIGANGAGKSTLLMTICGDPRASAGRVVYDGTDITNRPLHEMVRLGIAQSPEGRRIFPRMTVFENLQMGAFAGDPANFEADVERVFRLFPRLAERREQRAGTMSGGEQQMLAIGRALMTNPDLLILDEATEGLAPVIRAEIWRCIEALKAEGQSILIVDKNLKVLRRLADRHYAIEKGRTVWTGTGADLDREAEVVHRYVGV